MNKREAVRWIKREIAREVRSLVANVPDRCDVETTQVSDPS